MWDCSRAITQFWLTALPEEWELDLGFFVFRKTVNSLEDKYFTTFVIIWDYLMQASYVIRLAENIRNYDSRIVVLSIVMGQGYITILLNAHIYLHPSWTCILITFSVIKLYTVFS